MVSLSLTAFPAPSVSVHDATSDETVRAARAGNAAAFALLYDAHAAQVLAVCFGLVGNRRDAEELLQDTFVRAWQRLDSFRGDAAFATWVHRIAIRLHLEQQRAHSRRVRRVALLDDVVPDTSQTMQAPVQAAAATADTALRVDLERAMARLPEGARRVFVLHDIAGFAHAEIATHLGIAEGTSKAHLFRARRLLRALLER